jgi:hypothetical protein
MFFRKDFDIPQDMVGADAVKGASVYGTKIIRPKKLVVANITY